MLPSAVNFTVEDSDPNLSDHRPISHYIKYQNDELKVPLNNLQ